MRYIATTLVLFIACCRCAAQDDIVRRIILIGNAGEAVKENNGLLDLIRSNIAFDSNTIVLYLGNNTAGPYDTASLRQEAAIIDHTESKAFFIPGFKEWARGREAGMDAVRSQQRFLQQRGNKNIRCYPGDGCPGPRQIELGNDAIMIIMDSQWWLHEGNKPDIESDCKYRTKEEILNELEDLPKDKRDKLILFVTHHPFENTGIHSGTFGIKQHIFPLTDIRKAGWLYLPLPVVGSVYPLSRNAISTRQDRHNDLFQTLSASGIGNIPGVEEAFRGHAYTIFIAGQEQNLQLLRKNGHYYINSGASGTAARVRDNKDAVYVKRQTGFTVLELTKEKKVRTRFYVVTGNEVKEDYTAELLDYSKFPALAKDTTTLPMIEADSFTARADVKMARRSGIRQLLIGENYRKEWSAPVQMKVLHIDREKGGLKITGIGGGHESKSLQLEDTRGRKWVFRSVNKQLEAVIPEGFQETIAAAFIHDMLSASNPYGALAVPGLQKPLGIVAATPQLFFMPNDTALGEYRPMFANGVGILEERKPTPDNSNTVNTNVALNDMVKSGNHATDQAMYLQIRLIDFLIADFDRHHGQYTWGKRGVGNNTVYYPIPKDRDQAFYHNTGLIMSIMRHGGYEFMVNFPYRIRNITNSGIVGAYMDMLFMNRLTENDWRKGIASFAATLTDAVIDSAVQRMPPEIYKLRGDVISAKLKSRRASLSDKALDYYAFITKKVNVLGGNRDDVFRVSGTDSGLLVQVYAAAGEHGEPSLTYARTFDPMYTREIRLYGFNGDDYFNIDETVRSGIRLKVIGGKGRDTFNIRGRIRNHLYDLSSEDNQILSRRRTTKMFSRRPSVNEFKFREALHNRLSLPSISFGSNQDDGVIAGAGITYTTVGFQKYPYASRQRISGSYAFNSGAYQLKYRGEFIDVFRHYDLLLYANHFNPVLRNFFGYGNESFRDPAKPIEFYRTRYDYIAYDVLFRRRLLKDRVMSIAAGPAAYHYWYDEKPNRSRVLEHPTDVGLDSASVYSKKIYAGGKVNLAINTLNSELLPIRGINWNTELTLLQTLNENAPSYTRLMSTLDIYAVLSEPNRLLAALHFGGGHIFSKEFEYFQALTLGGNNYLRGYRVNRFAGSSMAYASAELKLKLFDFNAYVVKGNLGLVGFNDIGRVWVRNDRSLKWHHGYGGGIYIVPFNTAMLSLVVGVSEEDQLLNLSLGTQLNLVFQGL
jgi:hypothetical protein